MFEKLNQLLKENVKNEVFLSAGIKVDAIESAGHDASGVIIDVLKSQLENGKANDLMSFFRGKKAESDLLFSMMVNKYANRLNKYYTITSSDAKELAAVIIPKVMKLFVVQAKADKNEEKWIFAILNWLSGYTVNFEEFFLKMHRLQMA